MRYGATLKALRILSYADNSEKRLMQKLERAGYDREICIEVVRDMSARGYIDESRQLPSLILNEAKRKRIGKRKLLPHLISLGYPRKKIEQAIEILTDSGELDFSEIKKELISAKLGDNPDCEEKKKLLYKHGFDIC